MSSGRASSGTAVVVRTSPEGTVRVEIAGRLGLVFERVPGDRRVAVASDADGAPARLEPGPDHVGGWIALDDRDPPTELGRTTPLGGPGVGGATTMALRDGRAFRVVARYGAQSSVALAGWEMPGAFLEATVDDAVWTIRTTVAGEAMGIDLTMLALLAAELTVGGGDDRETIS